MVVIITALLAAAWLIIARAPETAIARSLRRLLVDRPAARLNRISRGQWLLTVAMVVALSLAAWAGRDALNIAAFATPELLTALGGLELTAWFDIAATAVIAWSVARGATGPVRLLRGILARPRARRALRSVVRERAANDDEDRPGRQSRSLAA